MTTIRKGTSFLNWTLLQPNYFHCLIVIHAHKRRLQSFLEDPSSPHVVLVFEEGDAVQTALLDDQIEFFQALRELKQLPGRR